MVASDNVNQSTDQTGTNLQQPREDLQSSTSNDQQKSETITQSPSALSQDKLSTDKLKVGQTSVQNNTTIPGFAQPNYFTAAWLWMVVPIVLAMLLFWPQKNKKGSRMKASDVVPELALGAPRQSIHAKRSKKRKSKR